MQSSTMAKPIPDIEQEIEEEFSLFDDPMMRYEYLIDLGKELPPMDEQYKTEENVVKGCQSTVYLHAYHENGFLKFQADSNTVITKGIIALLVRVMSGHLPEEILSADLEFIDKIQLRSHLSEQRSNGLNAMIQRMKAEAQQMMKE